MRRRQGALDLVAGVPRGLRWVAVKAGRLAKLARGQPVLAAIGAGAARLVTLGTTGYPIEIRRRLQILNVVAYLIAAATLGYSLQHVFLDFEVWRPVILINGALVIAALTVPLMHRFGELAGGLLILAAEYVALFWLTNYLGRESGVHIQYIVAAAAPFLVFGLERLRLVIVVVVVGLALHVAAWFASPLRQIAAQQGDIDAIYVTAAITTVGLIAATVWYAFQLAETARGETDTLLRRVLPGVIAERLKAMPDETIADSFEEASVLFADISGFVGLSQELGAERIVRLLNEIVHEFDRLAHRHGVEKIKTIGDAYMAAAGVPDPCHDCAARVAKLALDMRDALQRIEALNGREVRIRIGIATGPVLGGVIGNSRFTYDVWGPTVNLASRLEAQGSPSEIHVCAATRERIEGQFALSALERTSLKSLGPVERWRLDGPCGDAALDRGVSTSRARPSRST